MPHRRAPSPASHAPPGRGRRSSGIAALSLAVAGAACVRGDGAVRPSAPPAGLGDVAFASAPGVVLRGWFAPGRAGGGAVLLLHGVGASRRAMAGRAAFLQRAGVAVLLPDFRAHGESGGARTTYGALESRDAAAALAWLRAHACGERVGVIGVSMGGAAALLGDGPLDADALVLESVYPTIREATADRLATWLGPAGFAGRLATPAALRWVRWRTGVREAELQPIERIGAVRAPLLVAAGTADPYTPLAETRALYARAPEPKALWAVPGARHEDLHAYAPHEYERRVGGFLARHLARGATSSGATSSGAGLEAEERGGQAQEPQCLDEQ